MRHYYRQGSQHQIQDSSRREEVTAVAVAAGVALFVAVVLLLGRSPIVHKVLVPVTVAIRHPDRMPTPEGIAAIEGFVNVIGAVAAIVGSLLLGYACLWRYVSLRLPGGAGVPQRAAVAPVSALEISSLLLIFMVASIFRIRFMTRGLYFDEITTAMHFVDAPSVLSIISTDHQFNNHIANSLLAHFSQGFLGRSEWALRLPALLLGLTSLYVLWLVTRRILGAVPALAAVCGLGLSPTHVSLSTSARGYAGMILFTLISNYFYYTLLHHPTRRASAFFVLSSVTAIFFHVFSAFVVISQMIFLLYLTHRQIVAQASGMLITSPALRAVSLAFVAIVGLSLMSYALVLPIYFANFHEQGHGDFNLRFLLDVVTLFSYGKEITHGAWWLFAIALLCTAILGFIALSRSYPTISKYLMVMFVLPVLIVVPARPYYLYDRFLLFLLPYYIVLLVLGV